MVMAPVRAVAPVFAASEYATVPLPVPEAPPVMVIHGAVAVAVHDPGAVTDIVPLPAAADEFADEAPSVTPLVAAVCTTVYVLSPMVMVPVRAVEEVFGAAEKVAVPAPVPDVADVRVSQLLLDVAVHGPFTVIQTEPVPPVAWMFAEADDRVTAPPWVMT